MPFHPGVHPAELDVEVRIEPCLVEAHSLHLETSFGVGFFEACGADAVVCVSGRFDDWVEVGLLGLSVDELYLVLSCLFGGGQVEARRGQACSTQGPCCSTSSHENEPVCVWAFVCKS